jgi:hypothetical protein
MNGFTHQDEIAIRAFFAQNSAAFKDWLEHKDEETDHFAGAADAVAIFIALCVALKKVSDVMDSADKVTKHAKKLAEWVTALISGKKQVGHFELSERLLILVFDHYFRFRKGIPTERLVVLTGATPDETEKTLKRFESGNIIRRGKSGWLVVH